MADNMIYVRFRTVLFLSASEGKGTPEPEAVYFGL
jgi:hypothetical protein